MALLPAGAGADPLKSDACGASLAGLQASRGRGADARAIEAARQQALRDCLGGSGEARRPSPVAREPIAVPPPVVALPEPPAPAPAAPSPPAVDIERPPVITSCDTGGCWDSHGTRLNRAGPLLIGPHGACTTSGATVYCP